MATLFAYGVAGVVTGAVFVEKIFGWHGMGEWVVQGIATQDTNIIAAVTVFSGAVILLAGLLADVITPRSIRGAGDMTQPAVFASRNAAWWCAGSGATVRRWCPGRPPRTLRRLLRAPVAAAVVVHRPGPGTATTTGTSHWFGTNALGQDLFAMTLRGMQKVDSHRPVRRADIDR